MFDLFGNFVENIKNNSKSNSAKPFLKWAGGKTQLLDEIKINLPKELKNKKIKRYIEPFIGGGALFFYLMTYYKFEQIIISDINTKLINTYNAIKNNKDDLFSELEKLSKSYYDFDDIQKESFFYEIRDLFNQNNANFVKLSAYFIFLNKTCFNGLFRVNKKNEFNVPFGKYSNPLIFDKDNLIKVSNLLKDVTILNSDFEKIEEFVNENTFIYFDPPYRPLNITSSFNSYSKDVFDDSEQIRLANYIKRLNKINAKIMLSNSDPKNNNKEDDFFDKLYCDYTIKRINAKRVINSNGKNRGEITELLITNYDNTKGKNE